MNATTARIIAKYLFAIGWKSRDVAELLGAHERAVGALIGAGN